LVIPSAVLERLREGLFAEIGGAGEALQLVASSKEAREAGKTRFRTPLERLRGAWALLDTIGWSTTTPAADVQIDLREHHEALTRALALALAFAEDDVTDLDTHTPVREATIQSVTVFREFAITARGQTNRLSSQNESRHP
jgi:hypothetical protein